MTGEANTAVTPGVSVVIPVKGRVEETHRLLRSIQIAAGRCPEPVETILVDDSPPSDAHRHEAHCARYGARYLRGPAHVGAKRNLGAATASHDLLVFTDSDCRVHPDMLRLHVADLRHAPADVAGVAGPTIVEESDSAVFRAMRHSFLLNGDLERPVRGADLAWATTSNLALRRDAFLAVGGFVERSLGVVGGEDVDLGLKLTRASFVIRSNPDASVTHDRMSSDSLRSVCRRLFGYGRSEQWLTTVYPEHRRLRCNPVTMLGLTVAAAVAVAPRTRGRSLLLAPVALAGAVGIGAARRLRPADTASPVADAVVRTLLEWTFDLGAVAAALQLRRPDLLFTGFRPVDPPRHTRDGLDQ